jgi:hypothetical protein
MLAASLWYVEIGGDGCWEWRAHRDVRGYGHTTWKSRSWLAHRLHWVAINGPIPGDWDVDHLCRNPSCVRIGHLEAVPHVVNVRRGLLGHARRSLTRCKYDHLLSGANLATYPSLNGIGTTRRTCKTCNRVRTGTPYALSDRLGRVALLEATRGAAYELPRNRWGYRQA